MLAPLEEKIPNLHIAEAGGKVGDIEVEIRYLKEMLRSTEASLPVPILSRHINWLIRRVTVMRNLELRPNMTISPREAFTGRRSCESDLRLGWYDYAQVYRKPLIKIGPETRTVTALALMPMLNGRGGQYYYDLQTESVFTGGRTEALPMPELVIQRIISIWNQELETD